MKRVLRHGYTTGACAAAAARGAALMLRDQTLLPEVELVLPGGEQVTFPLHGQRWSDTQADCFVIKDAGDDPDITNGAEVHAHVTLSSDVKTECIVIQGGVGIGRVTKPGLAVPPGEWAINPVPRRMIAEAVGEVLPAQSAVVEISIPDGTQRATKTLNERLGIVGGLSILGTTGIVRPISAKAWTDTIDAALNVAKACGCPTVVLSTGRSSEMAAQLRLSLPDEAYIMMGDHVAYAVAACLSHGFNAPLIACQFAKLLKIACGHENTHAAASELDLRRLQQWADDAGLPAPLIDTIRTANTAREVIISSNYDPLLISVVLTQAVCAVQSHAPALTPRFMLCDYQGSVIID